MWQVHRLEYWKVCWSCCILQYFTPVNLMGWLSANFDEFILQISLWLYWFEGPCWINRKVRFFQSYILSESALDIDRYPLFVHMIFFLHGINCPTDWFSRCQFLFIFKYVVGNLIAIDGGVSRKLWWYYFYRQVGIATLGDWFKVNLFFSYFQQGEHEFFYILV